ncbi:translin [Cucumis melo var. makuwa]|uniref:Translin n=1 Tax=Cucumis melo var. makuwa TaxID=1194695 RepID=A0A5A7SLL6_CUCMM|nr:translin [Cucumis melo var. makuwa]
MAGTSANALPSSSLVEKQFEHFRAQLQDFGNLRDCILSVAMEIESSTRLMQTHLLLVHSSHLTLEFLLAT